MSKLAEFIREHTEPILQEWESFARSLPQGGSMDIAALRDHAKEMLRAIAADLSQTQTPRQQDDKSKGLSDARQGADPTPAQSHGLGRAESGFTVDHMVAEFRALRASVIRLWSQEKRTADLHDLQDMIRFNEAIDQGIAESITTYTNEVRLAKDRFLAILGHDLRTPIGALVTSTRFILETVELSEPHVKLVSRMEATARRMNHLVMDLLEFTRTRFGYMIPIVIGEMDAAAMAGDVAAEVRASYPTCAVSVRTSGETRGRWDRERITQALTNLVGNAVHHGAEGKPIDVEVVGTDDALAISVRNEGTVLSPQELQSILEGMHALGAPRSGGDQRHLGLGLYIVDKIVRSHDGSVTIESSPQEGTIFTMHLPRVVPERRDGGEVYSDESVANIRDHVVSRLKKIDSNS